MANGTMMDVDTRAKPHRSGWVSFAGYLMIVAGFFHAVAGFVALFKPEVFVTGPNGSLIFSYDEWGWIHLIFGVILMAAASALFSGRLWGRVVAITLATLSAIANFGFIWAYPLWSIAIIALDIMIIYGVAVYGNEENFE